MGLLSILGAVALVSGFRAANQAPIDLARQPITYAKVLLR
jgi:hypothetical protein